MKNLFANFSLFALKQLKEILKKKKKKFHYRERERDHVTVHYGHSIQLNPHYTDSEQ